MNGLEILKKLDSGYRIGKGTYIPRRGFPRGQWQLLTPAGEFVEAIPHRQYIKLLDSGAVDEVVTGVTRQQGPEETVEISMAKYKKMLADLRQIGPVESDSTFGAGDWGWF